MKQPIIVEPDRKATEQAMILDRPIGAPVHNLEGAASDVTVIEPDNLRKMPQKPPELNLGRILTQPEAAYLAKIPAERQELELYWFRFWETQKEFRKPKDKEPMKFAFFMGSRRSCARCVAI